MFIFVLVAILILKNEYEKFVKDGFLFEPIKASLNANKEPLKQVTSANVSFTSDIIAPYTRKDRNVSSQPPTATVMLKNAVDHDRLLDAARGAHTNHAFVNDTEFRSYTNQQSNSNADGQTIVGGGGGSKRARRGVGGGASAGGGRKPNQVIGSETEANVNQTTLMTAAKKNSGDVVGDVHDYERMYEDEYDVANKAIRKSNPNLQLIDSINKELKRVATGYRPDASNA